MYWYRRGCAYADISVFACSQFRDACLLCMREHTYVNVCTQEHGEGGSSSNTMGTTESELQGTRRASDELKNKSSSDDSKIAELNDRLNKMHEITQARDIKEKALQAGKKKHSRLTTLQADEQRALNHQEHIQRLQRSKRRNQRRDVNRREQNGTKIPRSQTT